MQTSSFYLASRFDYGYLIVCMDTIQKKGYQTLPKALSFNAPFKALLSVSVNTGIFDRLIPIKQMPPF